MPVCVASIQASSVLGDIQGNTAKFTTLCREAAGSGAKFIVLPETALTGYVSQDFRTNWLIDGRDNRFPEGKHPDGSAQTMPGDLTRHFASLSHELAVYITVPFLEVETRPDGSKRYYNTVCLASPRGEIVSHYRKTSPWPTPELSWATAGRDVTVFDTEFGRVGLGICFDIHSILAKYSPHNIWALLYPIAWVGEPLPWYREELPKLLKDVNCPHYILGANWSTDRVQDWPGAGITSHFGPKGEILATTDKTTGSEIVYSTIPTQSEMADHGSLDLEKYQEWTDTVGSQAKEWKWFD